MKNILLVFLALFSTSTVVLSQAKMAPAETMEIPMDGPIMTFEKTDVDYGAIAQHAEPLRVVPFTNTGTEPLVIKSARGSCGCTVPDWPKEPIMPGETSQIEIRYATDRIGKFSKTVTITTNEASDPHVLKVFGNVSKSDDKESVPAAPASIITGGKKSGGNN